MTAVNINELCRYVCCEFCFENLKDGHKIQAKVRRIELLIAYNFFSKSIV